VVKSARCDLRANSRLRLAVSYRVAYAPLTMSRIQTIVSMLLLPSESNSAILLPDSSLISFSKYFLFGLFAFSVFSFFIMFSFVFIMYTIIQRQLEMSRDL